MENTHAASQVFGNRLGEDERTVTIREHAGQIQVNDVSTSEQGETAETLLQGPAAARDLVLEDYMHLHP